MTIFACFTHGLVSREAAAAATFALVAAGTRHFYVRAIQRVRRRGVIELRDSVRFRAVTVPAAALVELPAMRIIFLMTAHTRGALDARVVEPRVAEIMRLMAITARLLAERAAVGIVPVVTRDAGARRRGPAGMTGVACNRRVRAVEHEIVRAVVLG